MTRRLERFGVTRQCPGLVPDVAPRRDAIDSCAVCDGAYELLRVNRSVRKVRIRTAAPSRMR